MTATPKPPTPARPAPPLGAPAPGEAPAEAPVVTGDCFVSFSFDIAFAVDLARARGIAETPGAGLRPRRAPAVAWSIGSVLRLEETIDPLRVGPFETAPAVEYGLSQFGALSITYRFPLEVPLGRLIDLSDRLYDNEALRGDSAARVGRLMDLLLPVLEKPGLSRLTEDYAVYRVRAVRPALAPEELIARHAGIIARILRSEQRTLSRQEVDDALASRLALTPDDLAVIDWNAALVIAPDGHPEADEARAVLDFANVVLLELRFLDERLDRALDGAFTLLSTRAWTWLLLRRSLRPELRRLARFQIDAATLFESVSNSVKLVGDPYLARLYRLAAARLYLPEWDHGIRRKLSTIDGIFSTVSDYQASRRMEILEWIIILLIAFEVVRALIR